jgi:phosphoribosylformimino-5-aminoimidazole carboxamide ribotide isomerase
MKFRPCIDLHRGRVKQIVGSTLIDGQPDRLQTNFVAERPPAWFAERYRRDNLRGGHIIMLGPENEAAAAEAIRAWPGGMQIGGGINLENSVYWLEQGASHVIVTSWVFRQGRIDEGRLARLSREVGRDRLVLDLSCRRKAADYYIVSDRWQRFTSERVTGSLLHELANYCNEFLIHAADVEGTCAGIEVDLLNLLGGATPVATTYAGGIRNFDDIEAIRSAGRGRLDFTVGSALDIFGGNLLKYEDLCRLTKEGDEPRDEG